MNPLDMLFGTTLLGRGIAEHIDLERELIRDEIGFSFLPSMQFNGYKHTITVGKKEGDIEDKIVLVHYRNDVNVGDLVIKYEQRIFGIGFVEYSSCTTQPLNKKLGD